MVSRMICGGWYTICVGHCVMGGSERCMESVRRWVVNSARYMRGGE